MKQVDLGVGDEVEIANFRKDDVRYGVEDFVIRWL